MNAKTIQNGFEMNLGTLSTPNCSQVGSRVLRPRKPTAPFGTLVAPVGVPWGAFAPHLVPFGFILVALWLQLGSFGVLLAAFCPLWFHFGSFWFDFGTFVVVLQPSPFAHSIP